jgi:hypothetical protein
MLHIIIVLQIVIVQSMDKLLPISMMLSIDTRLDIEIVL